MRFRQIKYLFLLLLLLTACNNFKSALRRHNHLSDSEKLLITSTFIEATRLRLIGDVENATRLYNSIIEQDKMHDASLYELARLKTASGETNEAIELLKTAIKVDPQNIWYKLAYADAFEKIGKHKEAADLYYALRIKHPEKLELYEYEAQCYVNNNEFQKAINVYDQLELLTGTTEQIGINKYYIYQNWRKPDKAMNEIQKLADKFPENSQYALALIEYYMRTGKAWLALNYINSALKNDPENALAHAYLADYYHISGNDSSAKKEIFHIMNSELIGIDEKISLFMDIYRVGNVYGDTAVIYPMLDTLVKIHYNEAKAWAMYADFLNSKNREDEALMMWKKSLEYDKSVYAIWNLVMDLFYKNQQYDSLLKYSAEASDLFPEQSSAWFYLGVAQYYAELYPKAELSLELSLDLPMSKSDKKNTAMYFLAKSYLKNGKNSKSDAMFEKLIKADSDNLNAKNDYAYSLALRNENIDKAKKLTEEVLDKNNNKFEYQHTYGLVLFRLEQYDNSINAYLKAIDLAGNDCNGALLEHYADVLYFKGKNSEALKFWIKARDLGGAGKFIDKKIADKKYYE